MMNLDEIEATLRDGLTKVEAQPVTERGVDVDARKWLAKTQKPRQALDTVIYDETSSGIWIVDEIEKGHPDVLIMYRPRTREYMNIEFKTLLERVASGEFSVSNV